MARTFISSNCDVHTPSAVYRQVKFIHRQGHGGATVIPRRGAEVLAEAPSPVVDITSPTRRTHVVTFAPLEDGSTPEPWTVHLLKGCGC